MTISTFNPLACGTPEEALAALAHGANLTLTADQEKAILAIMRSLPASATLRDLFDAFDEQAARKLRISRQALEAAKPLLAALEFAGFGATH